jgi:hypothetical protein
MVSPKVNPCPLPSRCSSGRRGFSDTVARPLKTPEAPSAKSASEAMRASTVNPFGVSM